MLASKGETAQMKRWQRAFWPVHRHELKKLIPMLLLFFFISFNYNALKILKDTVVITANHSGAEVIPFLKVWVILPVAILFTSIFTRLSHRFKRESVFYVMISFFLAYFLLFTLVLYPARETLHPHQFANELEQILPTGCKGLVSLLRNWTLTSFYAMAELWGTTILFLLFWGFTNQVTRVQEAKRFYGIFGIAINFSGVIAGLVSLWLCNLSFHPALPFGTTAWEQSQTLILSCVILSGLISLALFAWMHSQQLTKPATDSHHIKKEIQKKQSRISFRKALAYLVRSRYLIYLTLIVLSYNLVNNLVEIVWKNELKQLYPDSSSYHQYTSQLTTMIGIFATFVSIFISGNSIRKFGWTFTSLLTPITCLVTCIGFFFFYFTKSYIGDLTYAFFGMSPLAITVLFGSTQNLCMRGAKYTVFDATKEIAFVPLSPVAKLKGKAVIDGVASRLGKSTGSVIQMILLLIFTTISASASCVACSIFLIISLWILVTRSLGKQFEEMSHTEEHVPAPIIPEVPKKEIYSATPNLKEQEAL